MELEQIRGRAAELFPQATRCAVAHPSLVNDALNELDRLCSENYSRLGFACHADCFDEVVPKRLGQLTLDAWCRAEVTISDWDIEVVMRPFFLGAGYVHFEIRHDGPLPGLTETGYRSHFTPLATFVEVTPEEFLTRLIPECPRSHQLTLF